MSAGAGGTCLRCRARSASPFLLAGLLTVTGSLHFIAPRSYAGIVPSRLPWPTGIVYASGAAELVCAVGLTVPQTRRLAGWASAALFVVVFPANVQMALGSGGRSDAYRAGVWARLPMQIPLIAWAVSVTRPISRNG
jgi:uncharacterized membrane protein